VSRGVFRPAVCCVLVCSALVGCGREEAWPPAAELAPPDQTYTVRGRITDLPDPARPASGFEALHEAIDDFVWQDGSVRGMHAMVMPFTPARELSLEGFEIGDYVVIVFEVRWRTPPRSRIVELRKLPADTELELREARPPG
jgi:hypothetical protein